MPSKFSQEQRDAMLNLFEVNPFPTRQEYDILTAQIGLSRTQLTNWFSSQRHRVRTSTGNMSDKKLNPEQVRKLEEAVESHGLYPGVDVYDELAGRLGVSRREVSAWFANERRRSKKRYEDGPTNDLEHVATQSDCVSVRFSQDDEEQESNSAQGNEEGGEEFFDVASNLDELLTDDEEGSEENDSGVVASGSDSSAGPTDPNETFSVRHQSNTSGCDQPNNSASGQSNNLIRLQLNTSDLGQSNTSGGGQSNNSVSGQSNNLIRLQLNTSGNGKSNNLVHLQSSTSDRGQSNTSNRGQSNTSGSGQSNTSNSGQSNTSGSGQSNNLVYLQSNTSDRGQSNTSDRGQSNTSNRGQSNTSGSGQSNNLVHLQSNTSDRGQSNTSNRGQSNPLGSGQPNTSERDRPRSTGGKRKISEKINLLVTRLVDDIEKRICKPFIEVKHELAEVKREMGELRQKIEEKSPVQQSPDALMATQQALPVPQCVNNPPQQQSWWPPMMFPMMMMPPQCFVPQAQPLNYSMGYPMSPNLGCNFQPSGLAQPPQQPQLQAAPSQQQQQQPQLMPPPQFPQIPFSPYNNFQTNCSMLQPAIQSHSVSMLTYSSNNDQSSSSSSK